ncbi:MAG: OmpA family protein [Pseudomonadota bacterium]
MKRQIVYSVLLGVLFPMVVQAADVNGAKDHPLISRYQGSELAAAETVPFEMNSVPMNYDDYDGYEWTKTQSIEGSRTRLIYLSPVGRGAFEVQKNYETALLQAGATKILSCAPKQPCARAAASLHQDAVGWVSSLVYAKKNASADSALNLLRANLNHGLYQLTRANEIYYVTIMSGQPDGTETEDLTGRVGTFVEIIQPKAMETGKVNVLSVDAMNKGLVAEGKIVLYGIFFDTDKTEVKPESKGQLMEMAKLLNANKTMKVFIVGHTDNQGVLANNLVLSQNRAAAIVAILVNEFKVAAAQLNAKGVANFSPLATNQTDSGRAKNRRVELVVQ